MRSTHAQNNPTKECSSRRYCCDSIYRGVYSTHPVCAVTAALQCSSMQRFQRDRAIKRRYVAVDSRQHSLSKQWTEKGLRQQQCWTVLAGPTAMLLSEGNHNHTQTRADTKNVSKMVPQQAPAAAAVTTQSTDEAQASALQQQQRFAVSLCREV